VWWGLGHAFSLDAAAVWMMCWWQVLRGGMLLLLTQHCRSARGRLALEALLGDTTIAMRTGLPLLALLQKPRLLGDSSNDADCVMMELLGVLLGLLGVCWAAGSRWEMPSWWSTTPSTAGIRVLPPGLLLPHLVKIRSQTCIQQRVRCFCAFKRLQPASAAALLPQGVFESV
jgi:hypothetical protein